MWDAKPMQLHRLASLMSIDVNFKKFWMELFKRTKFEFEWKLGLWVLTVDPIFCLASLASRSCFFFQVVCITVLDYTHLYCWLHLQVESQLHQSWFLLDFLQFWGNVANLNAFAKIYFHWKHPVTRRFWSLQFGGPICHTVNTSPDNLLCAASFFALKAVLVERLYLVFFFCILTIKLLQLLSRSSQ